MATNVLMSADQQAQLASERRQKEQTRHNNAILLEDYLNQSHNKYHDAVSRGNNTVSHSRQAIVIEDSLKVFDKYKDNKEVMLALGAAVEYGTSKPNNYQVLRHMFIGAAMATSLVVGYKYRHDIKDFISNKVSNFVSPASAEPQNFSKQYAAGTYQPR